MFVRLILKERIKVESKIKRVEKEQGSRKGGSDGEPSRGRLQPSRRIERAFLGCEEQQRY